MLHLEIELLTGVYRASLPDGSRAEWPPHPERVFSALVQSWGDGGRRADERAVLEWLEGAAPPEIEATHVPPEHERVAPTVYVPPNDAGGGDLEALPERRKRQGRTFRAVVPADRFVRFRWREAPRGGVEALTALGQRVSSLGHSSSLVRFAFTTADVPVALDTYRPDLDGEHSLRAPYAGRLDDLERWFAPTHEGVGQERPRSRHAISYTRVTGSNDRTQRPQSVFGGPENWVVFEEFDKQSREAGRPDILAFAHVARRVRDAFMSLGPQPPIELISGHGASGGPSAAPHMAVVPMANVGFGRSEGDLLGFAIVLPRQCDGDARRVFLKTLGDFVRFEKGRALAQLQLSTRMNWTLARVVDPERSSLHPDRWCASSRSWASSTPVILDRHPEKGDVVEEARLIAAACGNIGLPQPEVIEIHKHSALRGATSAYPGKGGGADWSFPQTSSLRDRPRRHVVLRFEQPVTGPVLIGAGRFQGFGACLPIRDDGQAS
jgi:CRISPR-associated protein Csb2